MKPALSRLYLHARALAINGVVQAGNGCQFHSSFGQEYAETSGAFSVGRLRHMLDLMDKNRIRPSFTEYASLIQQCGNAKALAEGKQLHFHLKKIGYKRHRMLANLLVVMYSKCGSLEDAATVFQEIHKKNVYTYTVMIGAYAECQRSKDAFHLFSRMTQEGITPDEATFVAVLSACCSHSDLEQGRVVHSLIEESGCGANVVVGNALLNMYGKCGSFVDAVKFFDSMLLRDVVSWNTLIATCGWHSQGKLAFDLFCQMQQDGMKPNGVTFVNVLGACDTYKEGKLIHKQLVEQGLEGNVVIGTAVVNMYRRCGDLQEALQAFSKISTGDVVLWNTMIAAFAQHGSGMKAVELFSQMCQRGIKPDEISFISVLNACNHTGLVDEGCQFFFSMSRDYHITPAVDHCRCVIDLLGRAGRLVEAEHFMRSMPFQNDTLMWMSLLGSCRKHGDLQRGKWAAENLLALDPNNDAAHVVLANIYAGTCKWDDTVKVHGTMRKHVI